MFAIYRFRCSLPINVQSMRVITATHHTCDMYLLGVLRVLFKSVESSQLVFRTRRGEENRNRKETTREERKKPNKEKNKNRKEKEKNTRVLVKFSSFGLHFHDRSFVCVPQLSKFMNVLLLLLFESLELFGLNCYLPFAV